MNNLLMKDQHIFLNQLVVLLRSNLAGKYIKTGSMIGALLSLDNATAGEVALEYSSEEIFEVLNWGYKNRGIRLSGLIQAGMDLIGNEDKDRLKIMCYLSFLLKPWVNIDSPGQEHLTSCSSFLRRIKYLDIGSINC